MGSSSSWTAFAPSAVVPRSTPGRHRALPRTPPRGLPRGPGALVLASGVAAALTVPAAAPALATDRPLPVATDDARAAGPQAHGSDAAPGAPTPDLPAPMPTSPATSSDAASPASSAGPTVASSGSPAVTPPAPSSAPAPASSPVAGVDRGRLAAAVVEALARQGAQAQAGDTLVVVVQLPEATAGSPSPAVAVSPPSIATRPASPPPVVPGTSVPGPPVSPAPATPAGGDEGTPSTPAPTAPGETAEDGDGDAPPTSPPDSPEGRASAPSADLPQGPTVESGTSAEERAAASEERSSPAPQRSAPGSAQTGTEQPSVAPSEGPPAKPAATPSAKPAAEPPAKPAVKPSTTKAPGVSPSRTERRRETPRRANPSTPVRAVDRATATAAGLSGIRYRWGGTSTKGFDCSGFTQHVYGRVGVELPRTAAAQQRFAKKTNDPRPGDLVFFGRPAHHVGIYAGKGKMYDAPRTGKHTGLHRIWSPNATYGRVR